MAKQDMVKNAEGGAWRSTRHLIAAPALLVVLVADLDCEGRELAAQGQHREQTHLSRERFSLSTSPYSLKLKDSHFERLVPRGVQVVANSLGLTPDVSRGQL